MSRRKRYDKPIVCECGATFPNRSRLRKARKQGDKGRCPKCEGLLFKHREPTREELARFEVTT